jgi:hypothetical protein
MEPNNQEQRRFPGGGITFIPGLILIAMGALFLLDNLHIVPFGRIWAYWPAILIALGLWKLVDSSFAGGRVVGGVLTLTGALFLGDTLGYFRVEDWWPLLLIGVGLLLLWKRTHVWPSDSWPGKAGQDYSSWPDNWGWGGRYRYRMFHRDRFARGMNFRGNMVHEFALFGATRRIITDQDFKGGRVSSVFGGTYLDLSGANMQDATAVLEISSIYGGATVRIPTSWNLEVHGAGIFGGFVDHTIHPPQSPDMKHLIVRGAAIFGGVTFKN